jgi:hypothetical protein
MTKPISNLNQLLKSMQPKLVLGKYVFCTVKEIPPHIKPKMLFQEEEGVTLIVEKGVADKNKLSYDKIWSLITLNVNSDLVAVGFLAAITPTLAKTGISVNVVSAHYHDHLFVLEGKAKEALRILEKLSSPN